MSDVTITIIGTGAVGTSLGLALKQLKDAPRLVGHDKDPEHTKLAVKMGAFDKGEWNLINACEKSDLIVLAIPSAEIRPTLEAIAPYLKQDAILSDTAQTKQNIIQAAEELLPDHVHFVGGNPIVAPSGRGPAAAHAALFKDAVYCLTPTASVIPEGVKLLEDMVSLVGAVPFFLDPVEHDGLMSGVVGLPTLLSIALVHSISQPASWKEMRKLAGGLFSQVSAGAAGNPDSLVDELLANKGNVVRWLETSIASLQAVKELVEADQAEALAELVDHAVVTREDWQRDFEKKLLSNLNPNMQVEVEKPNLFQQLLGFGRPKIK